MSTDDFVPPPVPPVCRICRCTDDRACPGGCCWVEDPSGIGALCSACLQVARAVLQQALAERLWLIDKLVSTGASLIRRENSALREGLAAPISMSALGGVLVEMGVEMGSDVHALARYQEGLATQSVVDLSHLVSDLMARPGSGMHQR